MCEPQPYLNPAVVHGINGENGVDYTDPDGHGTHVAGLIGAHDAPPTGLRGLAPGVSLFAFRVFGQHKKTATNYAILKAMILAESFGCDIINLSIAGGPYDDIVKEAVLAARENGLLVVIAAGNEGRKPVSYPAAYPGALAVTAMGREGAFPAGALEEVHIDRPPSSSQDAREIIAAFSNIGTQIAVTAPGVGALSTLPHDNYGPLSGTSMAAPVIAGLAACLLSQNPAIRAMPRNRARSDAIEKLLLTTCTQRGFGLVFEGYGMPDPARV